MGLNFFAADATEVNCSRKNRKKLHVIVSCSKHLSIVRIDISGNHEAKEVSLMILTALKAIFWRIKLMTAKGLELSCGEGVSIPLSLIKRLLIPRDSTPSMKRNTSREVLAKVYLAP